MKIGFLIVNYNDFETTIKLLNTILSFSCIDKIVVVDNKSTDDSFVVLKDRFESEKISVIQNLDNNGYASGINFGSKFLIDKLGDCNIIVSNSDIVINKEEDIIKLINSKPADCAIIAPIIKERDGLNRGWKIPSPMQDAILNIVGIHKFLRPKMLFYKNEYYNTELVEVEVVSGCFFIINSTCLQQLNYFDENTFLYYEENIIAKKIKKSRMKTYLNTRIEVFHNHSVSIDKSINHLGKYYELKKSQYYFQTKYNNANFLEKGMLKFTNKLSGLILKICKRNDGE